MEQILQQLIDFIKNASPHVWAVLVKQSYMAGIENLVWSIFTGVMIIPAIKFSNYAKSKIEEDQDWMMGFGIGYIIAFLFLGATVALLISASQHFLNPEFYAIQLIINSIHK